jgi:hypothetical protein
MQEAVKVLAALGTLPGSASATVERVKALEKQLARIESPISDDDACALIGLFGPDDCFGLAWTLLHLIETAPGWPIREAFRGLSGEWPDRLRERTGI